MFVIDVGLFESRLKSATLQAGDELTNQSLRIIFMVILSKIVE